MQVRQLSDNDLDAWLFMRCALWPQCDVDQQHADIERILANKLQYVVLVCVNEAGVALGFAEVALRSSLRSGHDSPFASVEALFVKPDSRRLGCAAKLVEAIETWAAQRGCRHLTSDAEQTDDAALAVHAACGFSPQEAVVRFEKLLPERTLKVEVPPSSRLQPATSTVSTSSLDRVSPVAASPSRSTGSSTRTIINIAVGVLALIFIWGSDISSPNMWRGAVFPLLTVVCLLYVSVVLVVSRYNCRTNEEDRGGDLFG